MNFGGIIAGAIGGGAQAIGQIAERELQNRDIEAQEIRADRRAALNREAATAAADKKLNDYVAAVSSRLGDTVPMEPPSPVTQTSGIMDRGSMAGVDGKPIQSAGAGDVGLRGNIAKLRAQIIDTPGMSAEDRRGALAQLDAQAAQENQAAAAAAPKSRNVTQSEAIDLAMNDLLKSGNGPAYAFGKTMAPEKTLAVPDGGAIIDPKTGKVIFQNTGKADRQMAHEDFLAKQQQARLEAMVTSGASGAKTPVGYRSTNDGNLEAIPGGPADLKMQGVMNADTAQLTGSTASFDRLATAANALLSHPGIDGITGISGKLPSLPGGDAANAQALLETLKSQVGFGVLQDMRNNSKTGGALGSVSDAEGKRLEANLAALSQAQSTDQFKESLRQIITYTEQAKDRLRASYNMRHADRRTPQGAQQSGGVLTYDPKTGGFH